MKNAQDHTVTIGNFASIKRSLDPDYSYVIFEKKRKCRALSFFLKNSSFFDFLERSGFSWKFYFDDHLGWDYLVTRCSSGKEDEMMAYILVQGLLTDTNYYMFKAEEKTK